MRLIDADALKEKILAERNAIPRTFVERYGFGVEQPNRYGDAMRGGIRKALRCMELTPTIDSASLRPKGFWEEYATSSFYGYDDNHEPKWAARKFYRCERCRKGTAVRSNFCPNCGADMRPKGADT